MRRLCQGKYQSGTCPKSRVCSDERDTSHSARANVLIGFRRIGFVFVFRGGVCCRVPRGDAVRNAPVRDKGVLSFNQRRSIIAKQNQCSEESKNENNGLPRNKYQHELTSGGGESNLRLTTILPPNALAAYAQNANAFRPFGEPSLQNRRVRLVPRHHRRQRVASVSRSWYS